MASKPEPNPVNEKGSVRDDRWRQLTQRAAAGDRDALGELYDESSALVYTLALRILGNPEEAEEVTLDVYMQVWRGTARFDAGKGSAGAWLTVLARSRAIDRLRSTAARRTVERPLPTGADTHHAAGRDEWACVLQERASLVRAALASLPGDQREAIELAFFEGLSHSELAARLGQPLGTVKTRIRLGMTKLRRLLQPLARAAA
jgi:RNA polymerase sigma-70 factor (ECF subfamily)